jgi:hypothetical protein
VRIDFDDTGDALKLGDTEDAVVGHNPSPRVAAEIPGMQSLPAELVQWDIGVVKAFD